MYSKSLAALLLAGLAQADFYIYSQQSNDITGGGGSGLQTQEIRVTPGETDCDDGIVIQFQGNNDASNGQAACDGCDISKAVEDQDIERLEIYNKDDAFGDHPIFNIATDSITLYKDRNYDITGGDGVTYGNCVRVTENPDDFTCSGGPLGSDSGVLYFTCTSELTVYGT